MNSSSKYHFQEGMPSEPCRAFTDAEWSHLVSSVIPSHSHSVTPPSFPVAIFISGLPGGGKSSSFYDIHSTLTRHSSPSSSFPSSSLSYVIPPLEEIAVIDFDQLRNFHAQYKHYSSLPFVSSSPSLSSSPQYQSYKDLVPWFISGTDFEQTFFRHSPNRGLLPLILSRHCSFAMEAVLDSVGCFSFIQHVSESGYRILFVHVHTPVDKAIERAERRAYNTGRWSSPTFINSREEGNNFAINNYLLLSFFCYSSYLIF